MKLGREDGIIEFPDRLEYRKGALKKILTDEFIIKLAEIMVPHTACQDSHGHSANLSFRIHPAMYEELQEIYEKHSIKFPHKSDYYRYLIALGLILDQAYWNTMDEDAQKTLDNLIRLNREYARMCLEKQVEELKDRMHQIRRATGRRVIEEEEIEKLKKI